MTGAILKTFSENAKNVPADVRPKFLNDTGAMRTRPTTDRAGQTLHVFVPVDGVTPEQVSALKQSVGQGMKSRGNLMLETANNPSDIKTTYKDTVSPAHVDDMLQEIGAHPEQTEPQTLTTNELHSPLKEKYTVEVTKPDSTSSMESIDAFSARTAIAAAQKKFPEPNEWRLEDEGAPREPSTESMWCRQARITPCLIRQAEQLAYTISMNTGTPWPGKMPE